MYTCTLYTYYLSGLLCDQAATSSCRSGRTFHVARCSRKRRSSSACQTMAAFSRGRHHVVERKLYRIFWLLTRSSGTSCRDVECLYDKAICLRDGEMIQLIKWVIYVSLPLRISRFVVTDWFWADITLCSDFAQNRRRAITTVCKANITRACRCCRHNQKSAKYN